MARRLLELLERRRAMRRERIFRAHRNPLDLFGDDEPIQRYRFSRNGIIRIRDIVASETRRNHALLLYQQVLIALQYYVSGAFQMVVGDPISSMLRSKQLAI